MHIEPDELEALSMDELEPARAAAVEQHAAACAECGAELKLLRAERALMVKRAANAPPLYPHVWAGVEQRVGDGNIISLASRRRSRPWTWLGAGAAVAAAAVLAVVVRPGVRRVDGAPDAAGVAAAEEDDPTDAEASAALDRAERDYASAVSVLESKLDKKTAAKLQPMRTRLADARAIAGGDVSARLRILTGYSAYLRSLQRAVDSEEAAP
jgi:hypothetical protein